MVIAFLNLKGGVGKTTLAVHVAWELARTGADVLLLDADGLSLRHDGLRPAQSAPRRPAACAAAATGS